MLSGLAACFEGLDPAAQKQLAAVLSDPRNTPAKLFEMSRGHAQAGFPAQAKCLYGVAKERLIACASTKEGRDAIAYYLNDPTTTDTTLKNAAVTFEQMGQPATGKCLRDFAALLKPGAHP